VGTLEGDDDLRQEVRRGDARCDDRQGTGRSLTELTNPSGGLHEKRMGAEHVIRKELARGSQLTAPRPAHDQFHPHLPLHGRDVLGDGGLTDPELPRRR
jgi:hypothetical protein